jgi:acetylornithine deacetylase
MGSTSQLITDRVENRADRLTGILQDLVRIPSENRAPAGSELRCQRYVAQLLRDNGCEPSVYTPDSVPELAGHPLYWPGRDYSNRPNVAARVIGAGGGRSLVLSGHIDTVPAGSEPWTHDPFGGVIENNRLYGRGSCDMKCGIATNLFVIESLRELGIQLQGDLIFESVVDEEFGGANGTLAGRLMNFNADAAIISEPSSLRVCPAQRGGRTAHIHFVARNEGILGGPSASVVEQLRVFLNASEAFARTRRLSARVHTFYSHLENPVPAKVTRIHTAPWGTAEPTNIPGRCDLEFFWEAMPGETQDDVDREFFNWFEATIRSEPSLFPAAPRVTFPIRWLPGSAIGTDEPMVHELRACAAEVTGSAPLVQGIEGPCDLFVFHHFNTPAVLWGARGGNLHNPDEYVEIDSLVESAKVLLAFVFRWCGAAA